MRLSDQDIERLASRAVETVDRSYAVSAVTPGVLRRLADIAPAPLAAKAG
jgi:hypothetical protein